MIPRSDPEFVGWPQPKLHGHFLFCPRSDPEFVGWPQLHSLVGADPLPGVTLNLWGGRNACPARAAPRAPGVTLNLWGGRNGVLFLTGACDPGVTLNLWGGRNLTAG